jgi:murein DD-endopeptidase MepM/ murein hydrolase activator NlpD
MPMMKKILFKTSKVIAIIAGFFLLVFLAGYLIPQNLTMPVEGAGSNSYNKNSFWAYPWGTSITHKGVDIFAPIGTNVKAATNGLVVYTGKGKKGGNVVLILGPKWRYHYYAHLKEIKTRNFRLVKKGTVIGTVGDTGNAAGKPAHLHYSISTPVPYFWRYDKDAVQGYLKMFYLNPIDYFSE